MIIEPKVINNVCLTAHPEGCRVATREQITWAKARDSITMPRRVLIIGASTGYGLASRVVAAFSGGAHTMGVSFEKSPSAKRPGSPGWYNNAAFEEEAKAAGLMAETIDGDAYSHELKKQTIERIRTTMGKIDLLVYSLASPVRVDPDTGESYRSVLKPIGSAYTTKSADLMKGEIRHVSVAPADPAEMECTVKVMGGEDWELWIEALKKADVLGPGIKTVAFSYVGPSLTAAIYREGTIGRAKVDLEKRASSIGKTLAALEGEAYVSVNKALMTRASAVIPGITLYIALLFRVMKDKGLHEGCVEQIYRLFTERLYSSTKVPFDQEGRIRLDDWEMKEEIQSEVASLWEKATTENLAAMSDIDGVRREYLKLHGFEVEGVDYAKDVSLL